MSEKRLVVFSGPSGTGKSTILRRLEAHLPLAFSVSHTTRQPRAGEVDGRDYHFVTRETFSELVSTDSFLEHAEFSGNCYGTSLKAIDDVIATGRNCILDIEIQGCRNVRRDPRVAHMRPLLIWIAPPSMDELERRLVDRGTETPESAARRLETARRDTAEIEAAGGYPFDAFVVNDDIDRTTAEIYELITGEKLQIE